MAKLYATITAENWIKRPPVYATTGPPCIGLWNQRLYTADVEVSANVAAFVVNDFLKVCHPGGATLAHTAAGADGHDGFQ